MPTRCLGILLMSRRMSRTSDAGEDSATVRVVRPATNDDPDFPGNSGSPAGSTESTKESDQRVWHVNAPAELAELQRNDTDIGSIVRLRLEHDEQPSLQLT